MKLVLRVATVVATLFLVTVLVKSFCTYDVGFIIVANDSDADVSELTISIRDTRLEFPSIRKGEKAGCFYEVRGDSHYDIHVVFHTGKELREKLGYMTSGMNVLDALHIGSDSMTIERQFIDISSPPFLF